LNTQLIIRVISGALALFVALACCYASGISQQAPSASQPVVSERADQATPRSDSNSLRAHELLLKKRQQGQIDAYFLGDSITRRWGAADPKYRDLLENWNHNFHGWNAADFGWGGDKTENILWRIQQGELDGVNPKVIVLMAGTNNVGSVPPVDSGDSRVVDIVRGVRAIVGECRKRAPKAVLVLMAITPRNDNMGVMPTINRINEELAGIADGVSIRFLNINAQLADKGGRLYPGMTDEDNLHLTAKAYQIWANALRPVLTELLGQRGGVDRAPPPTADPGAR
jgi:lysophospholipase L1-like esterase